MIEFPLRPRHDLSSGWEFIRGKVNRKWLSGRGSAFETVDLPHCWNLDDTYQFDRKSYQGFGAYRREIQLPTLETDGTWYLVAGGFYGIGDVWLDGRRLARVDGQYIGFDIPLPPSLVHAPHFLAIRLDNRAHRNVLPGKKNPDFLLYGGLVGGVWLEHRPWPRLDARSVQIVCRPDGAGSELVEARSWIINPHGASAGAKVHWTITDDKGASVAQGRPVAGHGMTKATAAIAEPRCW